MPLLPLLPPHEFRTVDDTYTTHILITLTTTFDDHILHHLLTYDALRPCALVHDRGVTGVL